MVSYRRRCNSVGRRRGPLVLLLLQEVRLRSRPRIGVLDRLVMMAWLLVSAAGPDGSALGRHDAASASARERSGLIDDDLCSSCARPP